MWVSPILLVSFGRCIGRVLYLRLFSVCSVARINPNFSDSKQWVDTRKGSNFNYKALELHKVGILQSFYILRKDPKAALSFLTQLKEHGFSLDLCTYAAVIRIICCWGLDRKLCSILVELIRKDDEERGFRVMDLVGAVADVEEEGSMVLIRLSNGLVKSYAGLGLFDEAITTLFQGNLRGFVPNILSCNFLMNRLIEYGKNSLVVSIFRQLKRLGLDANEYTYAIVIRALCRDGEIEEAYYVLQEMAEAGITTGVFAYRAYIEELCMNQRTALAYQLLILLQNAKIQVGVFAYDVVVQGFCREMNMEAAESVMLDMEKHGIEPGIHVYSTVICGHCKNDNLVKALEFYNTLKGKGIKINCVTATMILQSFSRIGMCLEAFHMFIEFRGMGVFLDRVCYNEALNALCKLGRVEDASEILEEMMRRRLVPDVINYTTLMGGYCEQGKVVDALNLVDEMKEKGQKPDIVTYCVFARELARSGHKKEACEVLHEMKSQGIEPNAVIHNVIIEGLCIARKFEDAEAFLGSLKEKKCLENYASMVKGYCEAGLPEKAFELFIRQTKNRNFWSKNVCFKLFTSLCKDGHIDKAKFVLEIMLAFKIEPSKSMFGILIGASCRVNDVRKAQLVFDDMVARGPAQNELLMRNASTDWTSMKAFDIKPSIMWYTGLINEQCKTENLEDKVNSLIR